MPPKWESSPGEPKVFHPVNQPMVIISSFEMGSGALKSINPTEAEMRRQIKLSLLVVRESNEK